MDSIRQNKVSRLIQQELSLLFQGDCLEIVSGAMVSVTTVRVSSDLSYAKIYLSIFPASKVKSTMENIETHYKTIRYELGKRVGKQMRIIPELKFYIDDSLDYIDKIDELLK